MIRSVIIEDEPMARESLKILLKRYCPEVMVCGEAAGVVEGKEVIEKVSPDLVFLDIEMPDGSGFRLLNSFPNHSFDVVFTTAFDQFAIKAIRFSALDYILKPISPKELVDAIEKVRTSKERKILAQKMDSILSMGTMPIQAKKIVLSTAEKMHVVEVDSVIRCESDNYYTMFYFKDGTNLLISKTLKEVEGMLSEDNFIRTHKSHLVNCCCILNFIKDESVLVLSDGSKVPVSRRKKERIMEMLNSL